jgi:acyl-CoA reductase-like NAD-dependent aldehyde dehydrogenase
MDMLINGKTVPASTGAVIEVFDPYTGEKLDEVPAASKEDTDRAVAAAREAFRSWGRTPVYDRAQMAHRFLELVKEHKEELAKTLSRESGKKIAASRTEVNNILLSWNLFIEKARHLYGTVIPSGLEANQAHNLVAYDRVPLGVIACILPFNFPCNLFSQKVAPALLSGNCVIIKPATDNPLTVLKLGTLLAEAGFPDGTAQVLTGRGSELGDLLAMHPGIDAISLTGSSEVGIHVAQAAAPTLKKVMLELGGNDPFIVLEDADLDAAVREAVTARFFYSGQICCAPKRYLIHRSVYEEFLGKLAAEVSKIRCTDPMSEESGMGTLISEKAARRVEEQIRHTLEQGGKLVLGGKRTGAAVEATLIRDVPHEADIMHDMEVFGPVIPVTSFETDEEAIALANASVYGLGAAVFTRRIDLASLYARKLEDGGVVINGSSYFSTFEMPFGGWKTSGIGNEGVSITFDEMTKIKNVVLKGIL